MNLRRKIHILTFLLIPFLGYFGCKSSQEKSGAVGAFDGDETIPRKYKSIYFHNFENDSYTGELTGEIRDALTQRLGMQRRFRIEPNKADADIYLYGKIEYFKLIPRDIDQYGRVNRYIMTAIVTIWVRPNPKVSDETVLDKSMVRYDTFYSPNVPPYESEFTARQRLVQRLCERIVQKVITGWYSNLKTNEELGYDPATKSNVFGNPPQQSQPAQ